MWRWHYPALATSSSGGPAGSTEARVGIDPGVTELVVQFLLLVVRQDLVRLGNFLKLFGGLIVILRYTHLH